MAETTNEAERGPTGRRAQRTRQRSSRRRSPPSDRDAASTDSDGDNADSGQEGGPSTPPDRGVTTTGLLGRLRASAHAFIQLAVDVGGTIGWLALVALAACGVYVAVT